MPQPAPARSTAWPARLALALIMAGPLLIINKGLDLIDSGYYLFNYRYAFSWPETNTLVIYLSNWLGGLVIALLPETGQYLALKIICVATYALVTWFSYVILREHFPARLNLAALALANAYPTALIYNTGYNSLSYLFLSAAILLMYRGLQKDRPLFLYLAAIILGLNAFVRLPNILQWGLAAVPFWHYWFCLGRRGRAVSLTLRFTLVMLAAWLAFFSLCRLIQGPEWLERELGALTEALLESKDNHSFFGMWDLYDMRFRAGLGLLKPAALSLLLSLALAAGLVVLRRRLWARPVLAAAGLAAGPALVLIGGQLYSLTERMRPFWNYPLGSLCLLLTVTAPLLALAGLLWYHQRRPLLSSLSLAVIVVLFAMPLGSNYSIVHYLYYVHLSLPLTLGLGYRLWRDGAAWLEGKWPRLKLAELGSALLCVNVFFWALLTFCLRPVDDDEMLTTHGDAWLNAATEKVPGVPALAGMRTNSVRAFWLSDLARRLAPYRDMPLVTYGHCPLCLFLNGSPPLLPNPWLDIYAVPPGRLRQGLDQAAAEGRWPLILMVESFDPWLLDWSNVLNENILKLFLKNHHYTLAAESPAYKLYLPPGRGRPVLTGAGDLSYHEEIPPQGE